MKKILKYLSQFNRYMKTNIHSSPDLIFVIIFFVLLFIPMMHISGATKSTQENRTLASKPSLIVKHKLNQKYGIEFNDWFNDRFFGRNLFINIFNRLMFPLNNVYQNGRALYIKHNEWMFVKDKIPLIKDYDNIAQNLKNFDDFCKSHNIKLYVLLVPKKEMIYYDILSQNYYYDKKRADLINENIEKLKSVLPNGHLIYPYDELKEASLKDYVFFKQSHHWTDFGAYIGYRLLSQSIRKDFKNFKHVSLDKDYILSQNNEIRDDWHRTFSFGNTTQLLHLKYRKDSILTTTYNYYDNKNAGAITEDRSENIKVFENKDKNLNLKLFLTGDSQNEDLLQFLPYSVKTTKYIRLNKGQNKGSEQFKFMKHYKQDLLDFKPDIVVISISSFVFFNLLHDFYKD